mmetsp:Transcript_48422/g.95929  ORF Transcript_48422/g.95929 Transcript_48422/m.95929 type:complete len:1007 (+) Transcript_48422:70-3090(+)
MLKQSSDGLSKVWKVLKSHDPFFSGGKVEVSIDESKIICMFEENVSIVDLSQDSSVRQVFTADETSEPISCFTYHPTQNDIVVSTQKSSLMHLNEAGDVLRTFKAHQMPVLCMAYDRTGTLVVTGSADRTIRVWDMAGGFCTHSFRDHTDIIRSVQFHPDPQRLQVISTSEDNTIRIFDLRDSKCVATFRSHVSLPTAVAFSPDGYVMASCGRDKVVNFYELRGFTHIKTVPVMEELEGVAILTAEHSAQILSAREDGQKKNKAGPPLVLVTAGEAGVLKFFSFSMQGKNVDSFEISALLHFPLSAALRQGGILGGAAGAAADKDSESLHGVASLHYLPQTGELLSVTKDYNLCFHSMSSFEQQVAQRGSVGREGGEGVCRIDPSRLLIGSQGEILDMALIPQQRGESSQLTSNSSFKLAMITNSTQVRIVDEKFNCVVLEGHRDIVLCVDATPDGEYIVTSSKDRRCLVWSVLDRTCVAVGEGHTDAIGAVCVSQNKASYASRAAFVVSGAADKILKRWTLHTHSFSAQSSAVKLVSTHSVRAHDKDINAVAVSPNDSLVASASQDKSVRLWRASDLSPVATLNGHKRGVWKVSFSPVDKVLVSCSGDRTVKMWSVVDHCLLRTFEGHTASVLAVKFVNRGSQLVSASADGLVRVWTVRTGECETTLDSHGDRVWALECMETGGPSNSPESSTENISEEDSSAAAKGNMFFFSGGSDSKLIQWKDATAEEEKSRMDLAERTLLLEQQMQNDLRNKRYDKALSTALDLGHSLRVLNILTTILEEGGNKEEERQKALNNSDLFVSVWSRRLDPYVRAFTDEQLEKVVTYVKEWNANARHCFTSQVLLNALLRLVRAEALIKHRVVLEALPALLSYSERHYQRLDRLNQASYMLEYFASMIALLPIDPEDSSRSKASSLAGSAESTAVQEAVDEADEPLILFNTANGTDNESSDDDDPEEEEERKEKKLIVVASDSKKREKKKRRASEDGVVENTKPSKSAKKAKTSS